MEQLLETFSCHNPLQGLTQKLESYEKAINRFMERYDRSRLVQEEHMCSIVDAVLVRYGSDKELCHLYDAVTQDYQALKVRKNNSFEMLLIVILEKKLDEKTLLKWAEFNSDSENVPRCTELLKF